MLLNELENILEYLNKNWTEKELNTFATKLDNVVSLLSQNPYIFQSSDFKDEIRRAVILPTNTLYYRVVNDTVEIISLFSNRQHPNKRNLK